MQNYSFQVRWSDEDRAFIAACPDFPGVSAFGNSPTEALREVETALELAIATYAAEGWKLPVARPIEVHSGQIRLRMPRSLHSALVMHADSEEVSLNTLIVAYLAEATGAVRSVTRVMQRCEAALTEVQQYAIAALTEWEKPDQGFVASEAWRPMSVHTRFSLNPGERMRGESVPDLSMLSREASTTVPSTTIPKRRALAS